MPTEKSKSKTKIEVTQKSKDVSDVVEEILEDLEDEVESGIFPDGTGPSQEMVDLWKKRYGQVYATEVEEDEYYVWRVLTRAELKVLGQSEEEDPLEREEVICSKCLLWPTEFNMMTGKAGIPSVLAEQIFEKSGFGARNNPIPL